MRRRIKGIFGITTCLSIILMQACSSEQLPIGAQLTIEPEQRSFDIQARYTDDGACIIDPSLYIDEPLLISLYNAEGAPIGDREVSVYVDYSGNTFSGEPVLSLYDDLNGNNNGVIDGDIELISGESDDIARVQTDSIHGHRLLLLRINVSCPYRGVVSAISHGVYADAVIDVRHLDVLP